MNSIARLHQFVLLPVIVLVCAVGCARQQQKQGIAVEYHRIRGLVMAVEPSRNRLIIAHEAIPHVMKAMTMPFFVKDSSLMKGVEVGDSVTGVVARRQSDMWLDSLTVVRTLSSPDVRH